MRIIHVFIFNIFFIFSVSAQFKTIENENNKKGFFSTEDINTSGITPTENRYKEATLKDVFNQKTSLRITENEKIFISDKVDNTYRNESASSYASILFSELVPKGTFVLLNQDRDDLGMDHLKYQQTYKGIPIKGTEVIFHTNGDTYTINGDIYRKDLKIDIKPSIGVIEAEKNIYNHIGGKPSSKAFQTELVEEMIIDLVVDTQKKKLFYEGYAYNKKLEKWYFTVDAQTGKVNAKIAMCKLHKHTHKHTSVLPPVTSTAKDLNGNSVSINTYQVNSTYYLIDASRDMFSSQRSNIPNEAVGAIMTLDAFNTSPQNSNFTYDNVKSSSKSFSGKETAVSAHANAGKAYDYFKNVHGRNSINGSGGSIYSIINVSDKDGSSLGNAYWNGKAIFYGNGGNQFRPLALALDVAGHELTHGVVTNTANLRYQGESGALNESFADIFGVMIERSNWQIGEDVVNKKYFPSGALRSLSDPSNGAAKGNYNAGYQPKHYSDRYRGSGDNGGVHINSGIPNYAFYLIATNDKIGLQKAEKIFYRALTRYLTSSSNFAQCRSAVEQAAKDLNYGNDVLTIIQNAYDTVGISNGGSIPDAEDPSEGELQINPGSDYVIFTESDNKNIYASTSGGEILFDPLSVTIKSVPSVTDNGQFVIFVDEKDGNAKFSQLNSNGFSTPQVITNNGLARNAVISKDASKIALLTKELVPEIFVYDLKTEQSKTFKLKNPTFTEGVFTENVKFADFIEFSHSGEYILYDAANEIQGKNGNTIEYWDIGLIKVFDNETNSFAKEDQIVKLFEVDEGESVGNPSFAKNNTNIITFDYINPDNEVFVVASNFSTADINVLYQNNALGYPNYSRNDRNIIFSAESNNTDVIGKISVDASKIKASGSPELFLSYNGYDIKWARWFADGTRNLPTDINEEVKIKTNFYPNPANNFVTITTEIEGRKRYEIISITGATLLTGHINSQQKTIDISNLEKGNYLIKLLTEEGNTAQIIIKL